MQKKSLTIAISVIVVVIVLIGGFAILHKSPKNTTPPTTNTSSKNNIATTTAAVTITKSNATVGQYLTDPSGNTLYTYGGDSEGVSNCTGSCLSAWPAYQDTGSTSNLPTGISTIKRTDNGEIQYTLNGMPLYYFSSDTKGQVTGNGVSNFTVAKPAS